MQTIVKDIIKFFYAIALIKIIAVSVWVAIITMGLFSFTNRLERKTVADKGFAVVELFTSEGCSGCPPADALIAGIQNEMKDSLVYLLAYHVDYWNRLGWKDPFSSAAYSERQHQYAGWLKGSLYTPQAVVNGSREVVGSEEGTLRNAIKEGLMKVPLAEIILNEFKKGMKKITLQYSVKNNPADTYLILALVEKNALSKVLKGENRGRTLSHVQIIRNLQTIKLTGQSNGVGTLKLPGGLDMQVLEIIVFLQNKSNGKIVAATKSGIMVIK